MVDRVRALVVRELHIETKGATGFVSVKTCLKRGQPCVGQIGNQHMARGMRDTKLRLGLGSNGLRGDAASPENG
jgi:hypothetical protein